MIPVGHEYGPMTFMHEHDYDASDSSFENSESESDLDTELQDLANHPTAGAVVPTASELSQVASAVAADVQNAQADLNQVQQAQQAMHAFDQNNAATGPGGPIEGDLCAGESCRQGCLMFAKHVAALGFIGTAIFLLIELDKYQKGSDSIYGKKKAAAQAAAQGGGHQGGHIPRAAPGAGPLAQAASLTDPVADQLALWASFPNDSYWKLLGLRATLKGHEWSLSKWCYVSGYQSRIASNIAGRETNTAFSAALVTDAQISSDYAAWRKASFDPMIIFATSASYPDASSGLTGIDARAVRLDYLARIYDKHIRNWIADQ